MIKIIVNNTESDNNTENEVIITRANNCRQSCSTVVDYIETGLYNITVYEIVNNTYTIVEHLNNRKLFNCNVEPTFVNYFRYNVFTVHLFIIIIVISGTDSMSLITISSISTSVSYFSMHIYSTALSLVTVHNTQGT